MNLKKLTYLILGIMIPISFSSGVRAQESASIQATATVIAGIIITDEHDLLFGSVLPNVDKSVDKTDIGFAGEWQIQGSVNAEISLDFDLPTSLLHSDSSTTLPLVFNNTDASYDDGSGGGQASPVASINPNGPNVANLGGTGELFVWIGGMVRPGLTQTGGNYAEEVTLTIQYTGN